MRPHGLLSALATLLVATPSLADNTAVDVVARPAWGVDIASRFLCAFPLSCRRDVEGVPDTLLHVHRETVHHQKPHVLFDFVHSLSEYRLRPKTEFSHPIFIPPGRSLDGKPRKGPYADKNPIFTRYASPNETYHALESSLARGRQFHYRLDLSALRLAVAGGVADVAIEEMYAVWEEREKELEAKGAKKPKTECESWIDVADTKVCSGEEFWKAVGRVQAIERGPLKLECVFSFSFSGLRAAY
jgi:hypothetical protein